MSSGPWPAQRPLLLLGRGLGTSPSAHEVPSPCQPLSSSPHTYTVAVGTQASRRLCSRERQDALIRTKALRSHAKQKSVGFPATSPEPAAPRRPRLRSGCGQNVTEGQRPCEGNPTPNRPPAHGHPSGLLLACIRGWQGASLTPRDCRFVPPLQGRTLFAWQWAWDAHSKPGPSLEAPWCFLPLRGVVGGGTLGAGHPQPPPPTSGSPSRAGGRRSRGCSGRSPVRSREAGRRTGRSPGRRVSAH